MSLGAILAMLVLVAAVVLALIGRMEIVEALMFAALCLAVLLGGIVVPWATRA
jgi:hypothetical protein